MPREESMAKVIPCGTRSSGQSPFCGRSKCSRCLRADRIPRSKARVVFLFHCLMEDVEVPIVSAHNSPIAAVGKAPAAMNRRRIVRCRHPGQRCGKPLWNVAEPAYNEFPANRFGATAGCSGGPRCAVDRSGHGERRSLSCPRILGAGRRSALCVGHGRREGFPVAANGFLYQTASLNRQRSVNFVLRSRDAGVVQQQ